MLNKLLLLLLSLGTFFGCDQNDSKVKIIKLGDEKLSVQFQAPSEKMRSSDLLKLVFEVEHNHRAQISVLSTNEDFGSFEFLEQEINSLAVVSPERLKSQILLTLEPGLPAKHQLPSLILQSLEQNGKKYVVSIPPMSFDVISVLPTENTELQAIEKNLDGEAVSGFLLMGFGIGIIVMLVVVTSHLMTADKKHSSEVSLDPDVLIDLRKGVKSFAELEKLICRFVRVRHGLDLAPLDKMRSQVQLDESLNSLINTMEAARFAVEPAGYEAYVKSFEKILVDHQSGSEA